MLVSLWNYFKGYVIVEVSGYALDRFINLAVTNGIKLEGVRREDDKVYMKTTIDGFKQLKPYAKKAKCRLKIVGKKGLPFLQFRYRKRVFFGVGSFLFAIGLYLLCSFVWLVEITGIELLDETEISGYLLETGYTTGKFKHALDLRNLEKILMQEYPEIVWVGAEFEGTKLHIQVSEAVKKPQMTDESKPSHIRANKDALITYIATEQGIPQVKAGDIVQKGDIIVSGSTHLEDEQQSLYLTHAKADVKAKTCYSIKASIPLKKMEKHYTDEINKKYTLKLFDWKIPLFHGKKTYEYSDTLVTLTQMRLTDKFPLPFYWKKEETVAYEPRYIERDIEEAKEILLGDAHEKLREIIGNDSEVLKQEITYTNDETHLHAVYNVIVEEDIMEIDYITEDEMVEDPVGESEGVNE